MKELIAIEKPRNVPNAIPKKNPPMNSIIPLFLFVFSSIILTPSLYIPIRAFTLWAYPGPVFQREPTPPTAQTFQHLSHTNPSLRIVICFPFIFSFMFNILSGIVFKRNSLIIDVSKFVKKREIGGGQVKTLARPSIHGRVWIIFGPCYRQMLLTVHQRLLQRLRQAQG